MNALINAIPLNHWLTKRINQRILQRWGRDLALAAAVLIAAAMGMSQYIAHDDIAPAVFPLVVLAFALGVPHLTRREPFVLVTAMVFMIVFFDEPHNWAFNEWIAPSSELGILLFDKVTDLTGIPALKFSLFEVTSLALAGWAAFRYGRSEIAAFYASARFRVVALLALVIPVAAGIAVLRGLAAGGSAGVAMTQVRNLPVLGVWLYIGFLTCRRPNHAAWYAAAVVIAVTLKCLEGWYCFFAVYGGAMGRREYLMEHITSEQICIAGFIVAGLWWRWRRHIFHDLAAGSLLLTYVVPYFLNLRRTSFIGVGLTLGMVPFVYPRDVRRHHYIIGALVLAFFGSAVAATWNLPPPLGMIAKPIKRFVTKDEYFELDYRDVENFNQYHGIMESSVLGRGFGKHLPTALELVDISGSYPLYDIVPHNNVLWIWCNAGPLGMAAFGLTCAFGMATLIRLGRVSEDWRVKLLAFVGWGMIVRWMIWAYGDLGFAFFRLPAMVGLVIGMGIRLLAQVEDDRKETAYAPSAP
jgi:hypothetical protein